MIKKLPVVNSTDGHQRTVKSFRCKDQTKLP